MGIPENIDALLVKYDITQEALARIAKVDPSSVTRWRTGSQIRKANLDRILEYFDLTEDDILSTEAGLAAKEHRSSEASSLAPIPLYGRVAAGTPIEMLIADDIKEAPARFTNDDPNAFLVKVVGNSMSRRIQDGYYALVSPKYTEPNEHDMFLVTVNGDDATIKHVRMLENGIELVPDSYDPTYRPKVYDYNMEDTPPIRIIGKIVWWCMGY